MENYPDNWPCKFCERPLSIHLHESFQPPKLDRYWCFEEGGIDGTGKNAYQWFKPMDNLDYVEYLAKNKELLK